MPGLYRDRGIVLRTVKLGEADRIDLKARRVSWVDPEGRRGDCGYDRLVLAVGSVHKLLPIPGVSEHAHGFRGIAEALYLRDHMTRQIELADQTDDAVERAARITFVVVGAGYTGTEVAAQGVLYTDVLHARHPRLRTRPRWLLLDLAERILPELNPRLSRTADAVLRARGVDVRTGVSVREATPVGVTLTDGEVVPTRSLIWCVGVRPDPLVDQIGLRTERGRLMVDEHLTVPGHPEVYAVGDAAAVPDLTRPGELTPMTAQHAQRQGQRAAYNIAASYGHGRRRPYKHHDLGFLVDLGGTQAAANPVGVPLAGLPAKVLTRGYHLLALPGNRTRTAADCSVGYYGVAIDNILNEAAAITKPVMLHIAEVDLLPACEDLVTPMLLVPLGERRGHMHLLDDLSPPDAGVIGAETDLALLCGVGNDAHLGPAEIVVEEVLEPHPGDEQDIPAVIAAFLDIFHGAVGANLAVIAPARAEALGASSRSLTEISEARTRREI